MARFGFDRLIYGFTLFRTKSNLGDPGDMMILSNFSDDYVEKFVQSKMFTFAPMVGWALENVGVMSWRWLEENRASFTAAQMEVLEFNQQHDVRSGFTISFPDSSIRQKAAIGLTARCGIDQEEADQIWERDGDEILLLNQVAHLKISSLPYPRRLQKLTARQREVLEWVSEGKTVQDAATILGLTAGTVEKHLRKARESLEADTTAQAVMKASLQRQIFIAEI
ncbi:MAG: LuxR family transcriptional regulator [Boseongicola sp.]|nr:MAG: LuxR family transcriptional regulator [Boseongicola sp.]